MSTISPGISDESNSRRASGVVLSVCSTNGFQTTIALTPSSPACIAVAAAAGSRLLKVYSSGSSPLTSSPRRNVYSLTLFSSPLASTPLRSATSSMSPVTITASAPLLVLVGSTATLGTLPASGSTSMFVMHTASSCPLAYCVRQVS